jgi:hypothetical protein
MSGDPYIGILLGIACGYIIGVLFYVAVQLCYAFTLFLSEWYWEYKRLKKRNDYRAKIGLPKIKTDAIKEQD